MKPNTKAILVSVDDWFRLLDVSNIEDIYRVLGCQLFDVVNISSDTDIFVDDEGVIDGRPSNMIASIIATVKTRRPHKLFGDVLFIGHDEKGNTTDCPSWVYEQISDLIQPQEERKEGRSVGS